MEAKNLVGLVVALSVSILIIAMVLMPAITDYENSAAPEYVNEDPYRMSPVGDNTVTITYAGGVWTIDGEEYSQTEMPISQNDTYMIYGVSGTRAAYTYSINADDGYSRASVSSSAEFELIYDGSTKTGTAATTLNGTTYSKEFTYTNEVYYLDSDGDYIWMSSLDGEVYVDDEWPAFNCWSANADHFYSVMGGVVTVDGAVLSDPVISLTKTAVGGNVNGVYVISDYSITVDGEEIDCRGYILPRIVTGDVSIYSSTLPLVLIIPLLAILSLVIVAANVIRRD